MHYVRNLFTFICATYIYILGCVAAAAAVAREEYANNTANAVIA